MVLTANPLTMHPYDIGQRDPQMARVWPTRHQRLLHVHFHLSGTEAQTLSFVRRISMKKFTGALRSFLTDEDGATMVEYGIMVALIAAVCVGVITTLGTTLQTKFQAVVTAL
jgi:pilus assembly protein Flp/PilA